MNLRVTVSLRVEGRNAANRKVTRNAGVPVTREPAPAVAMTTGAVCCAGCGSGVAHRLEGQPQRVAQLAGFVERQATSSRLHPWTLRSADLTPSITEG